MDLQIVSRAESKAAGSSTYFTGKPCRAGHVDIRYTVNGGCAKCLKASNNALASQDREKYRERNRAYYRANATKIKKKVALWLRDHPETVSAFTAAWRAHKRAGSPKWLTADERREIRGIYWYARAWSAATRVPHDVDHEIPLRGKEVCGLHVPWNLKILPASENRRKSNRLR